MSEIAWFQHLQDQSGRSVNRESLNIHGASAAFPKVKAFGRASSRRSDCSLNAEWIGTDASGRSLNGDMVVRVIHFYVGDFVRSDGAAATLKALHNLKRVRQIVFGPGFGTFGAVEQGMLGALKRSGYEHWVATNGPRPIDTTVPAN